MFADDAASCCITAAVRALPWAQYGYKLKMRWDDASTVLPPPPPLQPPRQQNNPQHQQQQQIPGAKSCAGASTSTGAHRWELLPVRDDLLLVLQQNLQKGNPLSLLVTVDVTGRDGELFCASWYCYWCWCWYWYLHFAPNRLNFSVLNPRFDFWVNL